MLYRLTSQAPDKLQDDKQIGDRVLALAHTPALQFSTYGLGEKDTSTPFMPYSCNIPEPQLEVWTFAYFAYSKSEQKVQYYLKAENHECKGVEKALHAVTAKYWFFAAKDGILVPFSGRLAEITLTLGPGSYRSDNFAQLPGFLSGAKLFPKDAKFNWDKPGVQALQTAGNEKET